MSDPRFAAAECLIPAVDELLRRTREYCKAGYRTEADLAPLRDALADVVGLATAATLPAPPPLERSWLTYWQPVVLRDVMAYRNPRRLGEPGDRRRAWEARLVSLRDAAAVMAAAGEAPASASAPAPVDLSAYMPAKNCRHGRVTTHKQLKALLEQVPDSERGIRRLHRGQHLFVHAGDWSRWVADQERQEGDALDRAVPKVEEAIARIRAEKVAKQVPKCSRPLLP
jgi:hypothetical protein